LDNLQRALEMRRVCQLFAATLTDESTMMEIASVFPAYAEGQAYAAGAVFSYGTNTVGDPQLYQVLQEHTSAAEWAPDSATSLYKAVGVTADGIPEWVQPLGASDAYNTGDVVSFEGKNYRSLIDANIWSPTAYPAGWEAVT